MAEQKYFQDESKNLEGRLLSIPEEKIHDMSNEEIIKEIRTFYHANRVRIEGGKRLNKLMDSSGAPFEDDKLYALEEAAIVWEKAPKQVSLMQNIFLSEVPEALKVQWLIPGYEIVRMQEQPDYYGGLTSLDDFAEKLRVSDNVIEKFSEEGMVHIRPNRTIRRGGDFVIFNLIFPMMGSDNYVQLCNQMGWENPIPKYRKEKNNAIKYQSSIIEPRFTLITQKKKLLKDSYLKLGVDHTIVVGESEYKVRKCYFPIRVEQEQNPDARKIRYFFESMSNLSLSSGIVKTGSDIWFVNPDDIFRFILSKQYLTEKNIVEKAVKEKWAIDYTRELAIKLSEMSGMLPIKSGEEYVYQPHILDMIPYAKNNTDQFIATCRIAHPIIERAGPFASIDKLMKVTNNALPEELDSSVKYIEMKVPIGPTYHQYRESAGKRSSDIDKTMNNMGTNMILYNVFQTVQYHPKCFLKGK